MAKHIQASLVSSRFSQSARFASDYKTEGLEHQRLIKAPSYAQDDTELYLYPVNESFRHRQLYLQSYKFTREETLAEKLSSSLSKFKACAWLIMGCNYKLMVVKKIKRKVQSNKSRSPLPLHIPKCFRSSN